MRELAHREEGMTGNPSCENYDGIPLQFIQHELTEATTDFLLVWITVLWRAAMNDVRATPLKQAVISSHLPQ